MQNTVNTFHNDKWKITFSNIPSITDFRDMTLYDLFVKSVTIPDYNITEEFSYYMSSMIRHPTTKKNNELSQLQITFKVSENFLNYYNLAYWMQQIRYGDVDTTLIRRNTVNSIIVSNLDNQKRNKFNFKFTECFLLSLSSLSLNMGTSDEVEFTTNFSYEEMKLDTF